MPPRKRSAAATSGATAPKEKKSKAEPVAAATLSKKELAKRRKTAGPWCETCYADTGPGITTCDKCAMPPPPPAPVAKEGKEEKKKKKAPAPKKEPPGPCATIGCRGRTSVACITCKKKVHCSKCQDAGTQCTCQLPGRCTKCGADGPLGFMACSPCSSKHCSGCAAYPCTICKMKSCGVCINGAGHCSTCTGPKKTKKEGGVKLKDDLDEFVSLNQEGYAPPSAKCSTKGCKSTATVRGLCVMHIGNVSFREAQQFAAFDAEEEEKPPSAKEAKKPPPPSLGARGRTMRLGGIRVVCDTCGVDATAADFNRCGDCSRGVCGACVRAVGDPTEDGILICIPCAKKRNLKKPGSVTAPAVPDCQHPMAKCSYVEGIGIRCGLCGKEPKGTGDLLAHAKAFHASVAKDLAGHYNPDLLNCWELDAFWRIKGGRAYYSSTDDGVVDNALNEENCEPDATYRGKKWFVAVGVMEPAPDDDREDESNRSHHLVTTIFAKKNERRHARVDIGDEEYDDKTDGCIICGSDIIAGTGGGKCEECGEDEGSSEEDDDGQHPCSECGELIPCSDSICETCDV